MDKENNITYFAETDFRNQKTKFGIKRVDRTRHMYIVGKTGMGKSTLLENLAVQDIQNGEGVCFIDPHGSAIETLLESVPESRVKDVIYFAPFDLENPISFNILECPDERMKHLVAAGLMNAFKKIFTDGDGASTFSGRMVYILNMTLLALLDNPGETLLGVNRMYSDKDYRKKMVANVQDPSVKSFWLDEYAKYSERQVTEATASIQNKIGQFTANPLIRNLMGQQTSSFDFREAMDSKKILLVNLSKGKTGPDNMKLIGGMVVTKIYLAAMSRANLSARELKEVAPFYVYVDEFQNFANDSFAEILAESRKYNLALTVANQYIDQMVPTVMSAMFGNVGSLITFRIGATDAEYLEKEFAPYFIAEDLVNLGIYQIYLKLMIDGIGSPPFSASTLPKVPDLDKNFVDEIVAYNRAVYCKPRLEVEQKIQQWFNMFLIKDKPQVLDTVQITQVDQGHKPEYKKDYTKPSTDKTNQTNTEQKNSFKKYTTEYSKNNINRSLSQNNDKHKDTPVQPTQLVSKKTELESMLARIHSGELVEVEKSDVRKKPSIASGPAQKGNGGLSAAPTTTDTLSLKDAIAQALSEKNSLVDSAKTNFESVHTTSTVNQADPQPKEVPQTVLQQLLNS